ncbi:MAG: flagellar basal-body rod protein FlgG [Planctomycetota bacterium]
MAVAALHAAASGMNALSTKIDVLANNLANVNTDGFKASRVNFEDMLYQQKVQPGVENDEGARNPGLLQVGLGVRVSNTQFDFEIGSPRQTGKPTDVYIEGDGFFRVSVGADRSPDGIAYTRNGAFFVNSEGNLTLGSDRGPLLDPPINVGAADEVASIRIDPVGRVLVTPPEGGEPEEVGQIELSMFVNPNGLMSVGGNLYVESDISGPPIDGEPDTDAFGALLSQHLESSNVDPVTELVTLIRAQRAFELNSQTIQAADETLRVVSNLRRF